MKTQFVFKGAADTVGAAGAVDTAHLIVLSNAYLRVVAFL